MVSPDSVQEGQDAGLRERYVNYFEKRPSPAGEESASMPAFPPRVSPSQVLKPDGSRAGVTRGDTARKLVTITFDGGFEADEAVEILDTLKARGIRTTVFLTGEFIGRFPQITRRIVSDGHEVGNHTMNHPRLTEYEKTRRQKSLPWVDSAFIAKELKEAEALFRGVTGREMAPLWRAPYGEENAEIRRWAFEAGYMHIGWTIDYARGESLDSLDWVEDRSSRLYRSPGAIKKRILNFNKDGAGLRGGIILMHLGSGRKSERAVGVLGSILDEAMEKGYRFVRVSELIDGNFHLESLIRDLSWRRAGPLVRNSPPRAAREDFMTGEDGKGLE